MARDFSIKPPVKNMISYRDHDMSATDNGNGQKLSCHSDQPTVYGAMTVKNVRPSAFDNFNQGKQGRQTEGLFHGQGEIGQVRMTELGALFSQRAVRLAADLESRFEEECELIKSSGGIFEVSYKDDLIFSKKNLGRFPGETEIIDILAGMNSGLSLAQAREKAAANVRQPVSFFDWLKGLIATKA